MSPHAQSLFSNRINTKSLRAFFSANLGWLNLITLAILAVLCLTYIFYVNNAIANGYKMRELETRITELTLSNQEIEVEARQAQSLQNVERNVKMLGLIDADHPVYVESTGPSYALAE